MNGPVATGVVDSQGRLVSADPALAMLQRQAGGEEGGVLALPRVSAIVRLARRLNLPVTREAVVAGEEGDLDLWVRATPDQAGVRLAIAGWISRPAPPPAAPESVREQEYLHVGADWIWATDATLRLTALSPPGPAVRGDPLSRLFALEPDDDGVMPLLEALAAHRPFHDQPATIEGNGTRVRLSGVPLIDGDRRFAGFRGNAVRVISPPSAPAAPAIDTGAFGQRLDAALRAPLDRIVASAETIRAQADGPLRRDYTGYAADIATAGRHLLALVGDLVDLQAIERPDFTIAPEPLDLADVARRAAGLLGVRASDRGVRIERPAETETTMATGDFRRVLQILVNLIGNAIRYSPPEGTVSVRCEAHGGNAVVTIEDHGRGIAAADQARIFDKFERVDPRETGGSGLGLYIARRLARAMGGDLSVESSVGEGARFTLTLPTR